MKSQVLKLANALRKSGLSLSEAFKRAWHTVRLWLKMKTEPTPFKYAKVETGEIREAVGYFGEEHAPKESISDKLAIKYYDLTVNGWRSFRADRLIMG